MAIGEFHSVPEINLRTANDQVFASCLAARLSTEKAAWVGQQLGDLAGRRPEELHPCFLAVQAEALSLRTGWRTEHGSWEPKESYADFIPGHGICAKTTMGFQPNDGSKSDFAMHMYNLIRNTDGKLFLKEDMVLCRVFRVPRGKGKGVVHSEASPPSFFASQFRSAADPVHEFPDASHLDVSEIPDYVDVSEIPDDFDVSEFLNMKAEGNSVGGWDQPSIDSIGGPKKRPRSKPVGASDAWRSFTKIYTKEDPKVVYAACHHCGRMMKLTGGSNCGTKSLWRHIGTCPCKQGILFID